jgi:uncharacterized membrane protein YgcG
MGEWEVMHRIADPDREVYTAKRADTSNGGGDERAILVVVQVQGDAAAQLRNEVERCKGLDHPAVARLYGLTEEEGRQVIAFEHIEGTSLHRLMKYFAEKNEGLGDRAVLHVGVLLLEALCAAHQARTDDGKAAPIVHGQLGPHQVLVSWEGDVKLMGLGLSAAFGGASDEPAWLQPYAAPEVRKGGPLTVRANVYTAGAMLWSLFARRPLPSDGSKPEALRRLRPDLPASITFPIDRALEVDTKRISAKALAVSLGRTLEGADREELRWAMEVCRVRCTVDEEFLPQETFPPKRTRSVRAVYSSTPPDSDRPTEKLESTALMAQARIIGPLPWDPAAPSEPPAPASDDPATENRRGVPRPSKSRRMLSSGPRRTRRGGNVEGEGDVHASEPSTKPRKRMTTKIGLADLGPMDQESLATLPAPARHGVQMPVPIPIVRHEVRQDPSEHPPPSHDPWRDAHAAAAHAVSSTGGSSTGGSSTGGSSTGGSSTGGSSTGGSSTGASSASAATPSTAAPGSAAPPSAAPHPAYLAHPAMYAHPLSQYPTGGVPVAYAPLHPSYAAFPAGPGSQMAPAATASPPNKWVAAVAITAVASFAAGLFIASNGVSVSMSEEVRSSASPPQVALAPSAASTPAVVPTAEPKPAAQPAAEPSAAPAPSAEPSAEPEEAPEPAPPPTPAVPEEVAREAAELPAHLGVLYVHTSARRAYVYVRGRMAGPANQALEVECGPHHVRLADSDGTFWHDPGQSVNIECRALTEAIMEPKPLPPPKRTVPWPPALPRPKKKGQFLP